MAKRSFSQDAFNKAAEDVKSGKTGDGDFPVISKGTYLATLEKVGFQLKDSGAEQISMGFQIDADDENHGNQYVYWNQNLVKKDGIENEVGLRQFVTMLQALTDGHADLSKFGSKESRVNELEELLNTRVKIHVIPKTVGEYTNYIIKVRALLENVYAENSKSELDDDDTVDESKAPFDSPKDEDEPVIEAEQTTRNAPKEGMILEITREREDGTEEVFQGTCIQFIDADDNSMIVIDPEAKGKKPFAFRPQDVKEVFIVKDERGNIKWNEEYVKEKSDIIRKEESEKIEEVEEIEPEWIIELKGSAAFNHPTLGRISGLVTVIDENAGKVTVAVNGKAYKVPILKLEKP